MRHIFDQYEQFENRLTHALISSLDQDGFLLREFIRWAVKKSIPKKTEIHVLEQGVPGEEEIREDLAEKKGLPDAWMYTVDGFCLLFESKVSSSFSQDQIERHRKRALKYCSSPRIIVILLDRIMIPGATVLTWCEIYAWGMKYTKVSKWAKLFTEYFEIVEAKMVQEGYLKKGTITKFTGIPFGADAQYTYLQAKRLLKLIIDELKLDKSLMKELGIDVSLSGRSAITGKDGLYVWDFLRLRESRNAKDHTNYPHLTFSIHNDCANVCITIPNRVNNKIRGRLVGLGYDQFEKMFYDFLKRSGTVLRLDKGIKPFVNVLQRHYFTQRSLPVTDAKISFDLRTSFKGMGDREKYQPQWLTVVYEVTKAKHSNLQMQVGFEVEYPSNDKMAIIRSSEGIKFYKEGLKSLNSILKVLLNR